MNSKEILNEFMKLLTGLREKYTTSTYIQEELCRNGAAYLNNGGYKVFFSHSGYAIAIMARKKNAQRVFNNMSFLLESDIDRRVFVYPIHYVSDLKSIVSIYELCKGDVHDKLFYTKNEQEVHYVQRIFTQNLSSNFIDNLLGSLEQMHKLHAVDEGIYNMDIKFENILITLKDEFKIGDIDGFGKKFYFGHITDSWSISLYGARGCAEVENKIILDKHYGILNDLYGVLLIVVYGRLLIEDFEACKEMFYELQVKTIGSKYGQFTEISTGKTHRSLKHKIYNGDVTRRNDLMCNAAYARYRMILIRRVMKKYLWNFPKYRNAIEDISIEMEVFENMDLMQKREFNINYLLFTTKLRKFNEISTDILKIKINRKRVRTR